MDPSDQLPFVEPPPPSERGSAADSVHGAGPVPVRPSDPLSGSVDAVRPIDAPGRPTAPSFQASAGIQGRQFAEQCDTLLAHLGFVLQGRRVLSEIGVEIDQEAVSPAGTLVWFEYKGSVQGNRPGLRRTDTMKKAIANGALLRGLPHAAPYVVITSHLPEAGSGAAMLATAQELGYLADVVCLYDPSATTRLKAW